jgi:3-dehydroquinate synthase
MKVVSPKYARTTQQLQKMLGRQVRERRYVIITDETVSGYCLHYFSDFMVDFPPVDIIEVDSGESCKQYEVAVEIWKHLLELNVTRFDVIVCIGGGSVCDLGGFIASTFKRGVPFIFVPTTLLAMTDAAIGGKNGIDFQGLKNAIGTINQPEAIFIYKTFLQTLPRPQISSGIAEVIKHGVIRGGELWQKLTSEFDDEKGIPDIILKLSVETKLSIVRRDFHEKDFRKVLNFGHSIGHALESWYLANNTPIEHGIAVAMGMIVESTLAVKMGQMDTSDCSEIVTVVNLHTELDTYSFPSWNEVKSYLKSDKKFSQDKMLFALPTGIGHVLPAVEVDENLLEAVYSGFNS